MKNSNGCNRVDVWLLVIIVLVLCAGCGSGDRVPVHGTVTFNGKPLPEGVISFEAADGRGPTTGTKITDGKYQLAGDAAPLPGKKKVRISAGYQTGRHIRPSRAPAGVAFP